jgi:hypothetical protein
MARFDRNERHDWFLGVGNERLEKLISNIQTTKAGLLEYSKTDIKQKAVPFLSRGI